MQAVILGSEKDTRPGAVSGVPKPLVDVGGRPFVTYLLNELRRFGFSEIILLVGPFAAAYREALAGDLACGLEVTLIPEEPFAGTAGALVHAASRLEPRFLLLNGDSYFDINLLDLVARPDEEPWLARLALRRTDEVGRYGAVALSGRRITAFVENGGAGAGLINGGVYWLKREILDEIDVLPASLERHVVPPLVARGLVQGAVYDGNFIDIGTPDALAEARERLPRWQRRPAAFLDRDGVLNRDTGYVHREHDFAWLDTAKQAVKRLNDRGFLVIVITNQAGVARGWYGIEDVERLHRWMNGQLREAGAHIDAFYYCPHHPTEGQPAYRRLCVCRKPAPGLLLRAMEEWPVDPARSFVIGDKPIDMEAAAAAQLPGFLMRGEYLDGLVSQILARSAAAETPSGYRRDSPH